MLVVHSNSSSSSGRYSVAQNLTWGRAGEAIAFPGNLAVHDNVAVALGTLHATPFVARQIVRDLDWQHFELIEVVNDDIGGRAFAQKAAILESGTERGKSRHAPVNVLEAHPLFFANEANQAFSRVAPCGEELGVRATIR